MVLRTRNVQRNSQTTAKLLQNYSMLFSILLRGDKIFGNKYINYALSDKPGKRHSTSCTNMIGI